MSEKNIVRYSANEIRERIARGESRSDWARVDAMTDEEIEAQMRDDPDWADFMDIDWSKATVVYPAEKKAVSIRLDSDVLNFFKAEGKGYQTRINAVLRSYMQEIRKLKDPAE
ncbi:MAG: BrnA antitoxin family protein [Rhizobiaceae bacterium]